MLESFNAHLSTNTPKGVIRIRKSKKGKQEMAKRKRNKQCNGQKKKERKDNSRYYTTQSTEDGAQRTHYNLGLTQLLPMCRLFLLL
jgi:ribosomal protein S4